MLVFCIRDLQILVSVLLRGDGMLAVIRWLVSTFVLRCL